MSRSYTKVEELAAAVHYLRSIPIALQTYACIDGFPLFARLSLYYTQPASYIPSTYKAAVRMHCKTKSPLCPCAADAL